MGHTEPSHAGPRHAGFWIMLTAFLAFVLSVPLLYYFAIVPAAVGALLALRIAIALEHHAERRGRRVLLAPLWVVLAGLFPTLVLWLIVLPRLISRGPLD